MPAAASPPPSDGGTRPAPAGPPAALTLIGTGHVFQVRQTIRLALHALRPDVVCVELDRGRLHALQERAQGRPTPPARGIVQRRLQAFQEGIAGGYGADVGEEMLAAVQGGQEVGARIALIDPPAEHTVRRVLKQLTWRERLRALGLLAKGGAEALLRRRQGPSVEEELRRYQDDPDKVLGELQRTFPTVHRIVIAERDAIMARRIAQLAQGARHVVAVVGDGHVPGLLRLLDDLKPTVHRLADVREGRLPKPTGAVAVATGTTTSVSFGFAASLGGPAADGREAAGGGVRDPAGPRDGQPPGPARPPQS